MTTRGTVATIAVALLATGLGSAEARSSQTESLSKIAFNTAWTGGRAPNVYVVNPDGSGLLRLTSSPEADFDPSWSPDRTQIAFVSGAVIGTNFRDDPITRKDLYVMQADGIRLRRLVRGGIYSRPEWSPDGKTLAWTGRRGIVTIDVNGRRTRRVTFGTDPVWSPDGRKFAFTRWTKDKTEVFISNADGSNVRRLIKPRWEASSPAWSPDGRRLAFLRCRCTIGFMAASLYVVNADGSGLQKLNGGPGGGGGVQWSPDGRSLLFNRGPSGGKDALYVVRDDGRLLHRFPRVLATEERGSSEWSPDGRRIAFVTWQENILVADVTSGETKRIASQALGLDW